MTQALVCEIARCEFKNKKARFILTNWIKIVKYIKNHVTKPTNSTDQSPSWEANSHSASQKIPPLLRILNDRYRV
jgi:hypothetical protein